MADDENPGWNAIDAALKPVYGKTEPQHFGTMVPYSLGGPDPITGISAYRREQPDHWHIVTYGFTELFQKETDAPDVSGYGFELTMRVSRPAAETTPPMWALNFLQNLGRYVFSSGNAFGLGHHMPLNSPICLGAKTAIDSIVFGADPELGDFTSSNGRARFLQVVGVTTDELTLVMDWNAESFLKEFAAIDRWMVTDVGRRSLLDDPARAAALRARAEKDGSSMASSYFDGGEFRKGNPLVWEVGALYVDSILRGLRGRTLHGRPYVMTGRDRQVNFVPEPKDGFGFEGPDLALRISPELAREMISTLRPKRGDYSWPRLPGFVLRVVPTDIKDRDGKVAETVG